MSRPRIAIVGTRSFHPLDKVRSYLEGLPVEVVVIVGGAPGVERYAEKIAKQRGMETQVFGVGWERYEHFVTGVKNHDMIHDCNALVAFWDGVSEGTKFSIELAQKMKKPVTIFYNGNGGDNHGSAPENQGDSIESGKV